MIRFYFILFFGFVFLTIMPAQDVLLEKSVPDSIGADNTGPNKKRFHHLYASVGLNLPLDGKVELSPFQSSGYEFGLRNKFRINNTFSAGFDIFMSQKWYSLKQNENKIFPVPDRYMKERIKLNALNLTWFQRVNIGRRGNYMGYFFDLGLTGSWNHSVRHITVDKPEDANLGTTMKTVYRNPAYLNKTGYGMVFRAGLNKLVLQVQYNLSDIVKPSFYTDGLETIMVSFQYGFHRQ